MAIFCTQCGFQDVDEHNGMRRTIVSAAIAVGLSFAPAVFASDEDDMAKMQQQLNKQVVEKPFSVEDAAKIDAYVTDAMKKDLKPRPQAPEIWQPGYTCANLRSRSYYDYRDCTYYYRYYGHYW